jgi:hypothetical protein
MDACPVIKVGFFIVCYRANTSHDGKHLYKITPFKIMEGGAWISSMQVTHGIFVQLKIFYSQWHFTFYKTRHFFVINA